MAWLQAGAHGNPECPRTRDSHVNPDRAFHPSFAVRDAARNALRLLPDYAELVVYEDSSDGNADQEPREFT